MIYDLVGFKVFCIGKVAQWDYYVGCMSMGRMLYSRPYGALAITDLGPHLHLSAFTVSAKNIMGMCGR